MRGALVIPEPGKSPVPAGFHESIRQRVEQITDVEELVGSQAQCEAAIAGFRRMKADTEELEKALAWVELQIGVALGKPKRGGDRRSADFQVTRAGLEKQRVAEFRRMAWPKRHRDAVAKAIRQGRWKRRQRLAAVDALPKPGAANEAENGVFDDMGTLLKTGARFGCVYADPPWKYGNQGTRASTDESARGAASRQPTRPRLGSYNRGDTLWYYFVNNDELYSVPFGAIKKWAFGDKELGDVNTGRIYKYPEKRQDKHDQLNDTWGRCVPIAVLKREVGGLNGPLNPKKILAEHQT